MPGQINVPEALAHTTSHTQKKGHALPSQLLSHYLVYIRIWLRNEKRERGCWASKPLCKPTVQSLFWSQLLHGDLCVQEAKCPRRIIYPDSRVKRTEQSWKPAPFLTDYRHRGMYYEDPSPTLRPRHMAVSQPPAAGSRLHSGAIYWSPEVAESQGGAQDCSQQSQPATAVSPSHPQSRPECVATAGVAQPGDTQGRVPALPRSKERQQVAYLGGTLAVTVSSLNSAVW